MKKIKLLLISIFVLLNVCVICFSGCTFFETDTKNNNNSNDYEDNKEEQNLPEFAGGTGEENDPYIISEAYQWKNINKHLNSHYVLNKDLNMGIGAISPIGSLTDPFKGNLDGKGYTIHDAEIFDKERSGLFGVISEGKVSNLNFKDSKVSVNGLNDSNCIGALVGHLKLGGRIENCHTKDITLRYGFDTYYSALPCMGGIAGIVSSASEVIYCSSSDINIKGTGSGLLYTPIYVFGGVIGRVESGKVDMCFSTGYFDAASGRGTAATNRLIGGTVGVVTGGKITNVYSQISVGFTSDYTGSAIYNFAGGSIEFTLSFCEFPSAVKNLCYYNNDKRDTSTIVYFNSTTIENANDLLVNNEKWENNPYWIEGKIHPEFVSYEKYLQLSQE